ncbi:MAG: MrtC family glutamic-type intramembrane protease [Myxococcota bacterium]|nr:MrtC family glutamic-type intramembrane protease [Myxococcota bacterium]MDW8363901.1 MrtC family glutamic-type intramembrane protease [Myxococcales bacterium]
MNASPPTGHPLREVLLVWGALFALFVPLGAAGRHYGVEEWTGVAMAVLLVATAVHMARRDPDGPDRYALDLGGVLIAPEDDRGLIPTIRRGIPSALRETAFALLVALVVFPPFALGYWLWHAPQQPFRLRWPDDTLGFALSQLLVVGVSEEAFFRGYVQTRLTDRWPARARLLGAGISVPALVVQSALFALVHLATDAHPQRLATFFPGLLFGWMRARRGGIGAAVVLHGLSNVYSATLDESWLR